MGMPILASKHDGGICETVINGENGYSFDPYRIEELTSHIEEFFRDPGKLAKFSKRSLDMAKAFTLRNALDTIVTTCKQTIS